MPEAEALRCDLLPSRRARHVASIARVVTGLAALACLVAVVLEPTLTRGVATLVALLASLFALVDRRGPEVRQIGLLGNGNLRAVVDDVDGPAAVRYCSPGFLCLRTPSGSIAVWPDCLSAPSWRRLLVWCRWPHGSR